MNSQPNQQPQNGNPWLITTLAKGLGTIAGIFSLIFGLVSMISVTGSCIASGAVLMFEGLVVTLIEAPCFCSFLDFSHTPGAFFDKRPHWFRATLYLLFAVIPLIMCFSFSALLGCGLIFITSALYLVIALGKKASAEEMRMKAGSAAPTAILVNNEAPISQDYDRFNTQPKPFANVQFPTNQPITATKGPVY